jgi:2-iminobutanoate/2-iminopropanoate deaminase
MTNEAVTTSNAPAAIGPYSQAIRNRDLLFTSGQLGMDPATGDLVEGGTAAQAQRALKNLGAVLDAAGFTYADVVKVTIYLADMADFGAVNEAYTQVFSQPPWPARSTVAVRTLPKEARIELEAVAVRS